jgi:polo-like kinase 1
MKHANICEYKHFFEDKVNCYILLELCHNQSMNEMIKRRKTLTEEETRLLMIQVVDAITFMHDSNVIHRDLKLGNLFLSKNMDIKVGDFGLACRVDSTDEKRRTICGTPNYIAPEVIEGNKEKRGHSFEVDIWSLGVICFTMLVGKPPYESTDVKSTYRRILANEYSFPQGKVSEDARRLIASMLQTNPKMRCVRYG